MIYSSMLGILLPPQAMSSSYSCPRVSGQGKEGHEGVPAIQTGLLPESGGTDRNCAGCRVDTERKNEIERQADRGKGGEGKPFVNKGNSVSKIT